MSEKSDVSSADEGRVKKCLLVATLTYFIKIFEKYYNNLVMNK